MVAKFSHALNAQINTSLCEILNIPLTLAAAAQLMIQMIHVLGAAPIKTVESGVIVIIILWHSDRRFRYLALTPFYNVCPCDTCTSTCTCNCYSCVHAFVGNDCFCETDFTRPGIFVDDIGQNCTFTSTCCDSRKYPPWFTEKIHVHVAAQCNHVLMILNCDTILIEARQFNVHVTLCTVLHVCYIIIADSKYYTPVPLYQAWKVELCSCKS